MDPVSPDRQVRGLYLHIPFCVRKCAYCTFESYPVCPSDPRVEAYIDELIIALRRLSRLGLLGGVRTIYIGGGTPTHIGDGLLVRLVQIIALSINLESVEEFTVEANPESLDSRMVADLVALGVTRISMGVQSFDDGILRLLGRAHDARRAREACAEVLGRGIEASVDLICGIPGQTIEGWVDTVTAALETGVSHISIYPLAIEAGSDLFDRVHAGKLPEPDDDLAADMMLEGRDLLAASGLIRYEISNYARPGHESIHNTSYWTGGSYLGVGVGASSLISPQWEGWRFHDELGFIPRLDTSSSDVAAVRFTAARLDPGTSGSAGDGIGSGLDAKSFISSPGMEREWPELEYLDTSHFIVERVMLGMRLSIGVGDGLVRTAARFAPRLEDAFGRLQELGLVAHLKNRYMLTDRGWLLGNMVFAEIWDTVS